MIFIPHIASLIALVVAVLLAPIQKWQGFLAKYMKRSIKTIVVIVLIILTIITIPNTESADNDISPDTTLSSTEQTTVPTTEPSTESTPEPSTEPTTEPNTESTTEPTNDISQDYVLNTSSMKFHYPSCGSADDIKEDNREEYHGTREELISKGYKPCGKCHP